MRPASSVKIVFLGESGVGKTSIIHYWSNGARLETTEPTVGAAFTNREFTYNDKTYQLLVWDTAGQEQYHAIAPMYYRSASIAIVVYDVTSYSSFRAIERWITELKDHNMENAVIMVVGNKIDLGREIEHSFASEQARALGAIYAECSAATGVGISHLFERALQALVLHDEDRVEMTPRRRASSTSCC